MIPPKTGYSRADQPSPLTNFKPFMAQYFPAWVAYIGSLAWYQSSRSSYAQAVAIVLAVYILVVTGWYGLIRKELPWAVGLPKVAHGRWAVFEFVNYAAIVALLMYKFVLQPIHQ